MSPSRSLGKPRFLVSVCASCLVALLANGSAFGLVTGMSGIVGQTDVYSPEEWSIAGAPLTNGSVAVPPENWSICPSWSLAEYGVGSFDWTGSFLEEEGDLSVGGVAHGLFQAGGVFSLTGTLWDSNDEETATLLTPDGPEPLFVGTVSAFEVIEAFWNPNRIDLGASITPTGGWLKDNGYLLDMDYALIMFGVECRQDGGDLVGFTNGNISTFGAGGFQFTILPEPTTAALLGGFIAVLAMGRRKRGAWRSI